MKNRHRLLELDLMKSFIIIFSMIGIHSLYDLSDFDRSGSTLCFILNILATQFGAPMFIYCMGATLCFSRHRKPTDYIRRGFNLLTIGMVLNVLRWGSMAFKAYMTGEEELYGGLALIYNVDIFQFAGLALMLIGFLKHWKFNKWQIFVLAIVMNIAGTLLNGLETPYYVVNQVLAYFYATHTCCAFPLLNWFIFVAAGNLMGHYYATTEYPERFYRWALPFSALITAVYLYLCLVVESPFTRALENDWWYYSMKSGDAFLTVVGVAPFMLSLFGLLSKFVKGKMAVVVSYPSKHINQYFCVSWVLIMWTAYIFYSFIPPAHSVGMFVLTWISIAVLTTLIVFFYNRYMKVAANAWFARHETAWYVGIWLALIAFGAWYFSLSLPYPYIMPY